MPTTHSILLPTYSTIPPFSSNHETGDNEWQIANKRKIPFVAHTYVTIETKPLKNLYMMCHPHTQVLLAQTATPPTTTDSI